MATTTVYTFTKSPVAVDRLTQEIRSSAIVTALDSMTVTGSSLSIKFKDVLSSVDSSTLSNLVTRHSGIPLVAPPQAVVVNSVPAFSSKTYNGKSLFKRIVGIQSTLTIGDNTILWTCNFPHVKFMAVEIMGAETGDYVSLYVLDSATGQITKTPNAVLNQFGFSANIGKDLYVQRSEFDSDLYQGLQIKIVYTSISAKKIGINFALNEVK